VDAVVDGGVDVEGVVEPDREAVVVSITVVVELVDGGVICAVEDVGAWTVVEDEGGREVGGIVEVSGAVVVVIEPDATPVVVVALPLELLVPPCLFANSIKLCATSAFD